MLEPWQNILQDIKKGIYFCVVFTNFLYPQYSQLLVNIRQFHSNFADVRLLIYLAIVIILLASVMLATFLGWVIYYLLCVQKRLRLRYLARQIESHSVENIPNSRAASPPPIQEQPSEEIKKLPERPVTRDLVEALAERAVKTGRWQSLKARTITQPSEEFPMKPTSIKRVRKKGFTRTRSGEPSQVDNPNYINTPLKSLEGQHEREQQSPTDGTKVTKF